MLSSKPRRPKKRRASGRSVTTMVMWSKPSVFATPPVTMREGPSGLLALRGVPGPAALTAADGLVEQDLAQAHRLRRDLDALVVADELQCVLQGERQGGRQPFEVLG